jgi:hypothetical protein
MKGRAVAFLLCLTALPAICRGQSSLNFPKHFTATELVSTGFTIVNPGPTTAAVTFTIYGADGEPVAAVQRNFEPGTQEARLGAGPGQIFGTAALGGGGWIQATSPVSGLTGFWLIFDANFSNSGDGAEAAPTATNQVLPIAAETTELNIASPGAVQDVQIEVFGEAGVPLADPVIRHINANGVFKADVATLFNSANMANARYIRVVSASPVASCAVVRSFLVESDAAIVNGVSTAPQAQVQHVVFPQSINDNDWTSVIGITNLSSSDNMVTITFTPAKDLAGVPTVTGAASTVSRTLSPYGALRQNVRDVFGFSNAQAQEGWIRVDGSEALTGFVAYASTVRGGIAVVPVQAVPQTRMLFAHIADGEPNIWWTGLAFLNTNPTPATVKIYAMKPTGDLIGGV